MAAAAAVAPAKPKANAVSGAATDDSVRTLVTKRETARFARDFETADKLREQLSRLGVALDDQNKTWRSGDGRTGPITAVNVSELHAQKAAKGGAAPLSDEEIDRMVKEREQARFTLDYKTADKIRETLEKHGVHLDTKENKWQAADGRSGPIGPVNISAAHAQKAARSGAPKMALDEIEKLLVLREQARARRDYKTADVMRDTLEKHGVYLDAKEKKWHAADGRSGAIVVSTLSNEEVGRVLANGWPTGVEVTHAMVHGGPFPSTSDGRTTSVGTLAMMRFLRPVCYQDVVDAVLPPALQAANPWKLNRRMEGKLELAQ
jgi:hypothetical protein